MSHYSTLQDFQFDIDVKDIRGAALYGVDQKKIGKITDVVFDHDDGTIHYLVADMGHNRHVMLPLNHIYRTAADEDAFETDLDGSELDRLPAFDNKVFDSDQSWQSYEQLHVSALEERDQAARKEVKEHWEQDPILHVEGSDRIVTPPESEVNSAEPIRTQSSRIGIPAAELFPDRITDKFTSTTPGAEKITLVPEESARIQDAAYGTETLGPRWDAFEDALLESLPQLRKRCGTCSSQQRRVA